MKCNKKSKKLTQEKCAWSRSTQLEHKKGSRKRRLCTARKHALKHISSSHLQKRYHPSSPSKGGGDLIGGIENPLDPFVTITFVMFVSHIFRFTAMFSAHIVIWASIVKRSGCFAFACCCLYISHRWSRNRIQCSGRWPPCDRSCC